MTSTELAIRHSDVPANFDEQLRMARVLADSSLLPGHLRGRPANVLVVLQGARALDVPAFWAFQSMHVIDGRLGMAAELMRALVIRAGHRMRVVERSERRAVVEVQRSDRKDPYLAEFSWQDAVAAGLTGKENWKKYPKSMLVARATAIAVRDECADVLFGVVYTPDELGAITDEDGTVLDSEAREVEPPSEEQVARWVEDIARAELEDLPGVWAQITDRGAAFLKVEGDDALVDMLVTRFGIEIEGLRSRVEARLLWNLARTLGLRDATIEVDQQGRIPLADYVKTVVEGLPEEALLPEEETELPSELNTEHARALRAAAAATWEEGSEGGGAEGSSGDS